MGNIKFVVIDWIDSNVLKLEATVCTEGKSKQIPLQAWTGPEGSRRLRLPDFKTIGT